MHSYWYVSQDKLRALGAFDRGWLSRVRPSAKVGLGAASVGIDLDPAATRTLNRAAVKAEQQLRSERMISDVASFASGPPPSQYFESRGPACRAVIENMLWVAGVDDDVAVLLVGSVSNAVGGSPAGTRCLPERLGQPAGALAARDIFSPSVDPIGAARYLLDSPPEGTARAGGRADAAAGQAPDADFPSAEAQVRADTLSYAWTALMRRSLDLLSDDVSALPGAHSVSLYVARHRMEGTADGWQAGLKSLVLGTPLYVEQVRLGPVACRPGG